MRKPGAREQYMAEAFPVEDEVLREIRQALDMDGLGGIQLGPSDARLLQFLIRLTGAQRILEIGTLYGYSTLAMAMALPDDGTILSLDNLEARHRRARDFFSRSPHGHKIRLITGEAFVTLDEIKGEAPFDLIFIDANKAAYLDYLNWAESHLRPGGLIVGDNTFLFDALWGESRDPDVNEKRIQIMREFNRRLSDPSRYNSVLVPTLEGMTIAQRLR